VTVGKNESVPVVPLWVGRRELQEPGDKGEQMSEGKRLGKGELGRNIPGPKDVGSWCHAHRGTRVTTVALEDDIRGKLRSRSEGEEISGDEREEHNKSRGRNPQSSRCVDLQFGWC
jgi:hypothetical protein